MLVASSSNKPPSGRFHGPGLRGHALDRHERVPIVIREGHVVHDAALHCQARQLLPDGISMTETVSGLLATGRKT